MARIRTIKPQHVEDRALPKISLNAHLFWVLSWCFSDDEGVIENDPVFLRNQLFPRRQDIQIEHIEGWIQELIRERFVIKFTFEGQDYLIHRTFKAHQRIERPYPSKIPAEVIEQALTGQLKLPTGAASSQFTDHSPNVHRSFTDRSPNDQGPFTASIGEDSIGEERRGVEVENEKIKVKSKKSKEKKSIPISFRESPYFNRLDLITESLKGSRYENADVDFYHESALLWSDSSEKNKKIDWLSTLRTWMLRDISENKFKTKNPIHHANAKRTAGTKPVLSTPIPAGGFGSL